jgi:ParB family chromosome partitioning protein
VTEKKRGLGRGLGALIPTSPGPSVVTEALLTPSGGSPGVNRTTGRADLRVEKGADSGELAYYAEVPITSITPNPRQPRQIFEEEALAELVYSLREVGLLQPIVLRPAGDQRYELVAGERRWRAAQQAGFSTIPAIIRETDDDELLRDSLLENLHRAQLNPLEEAAAYGQLLTDFGCTQDQLAQRIGRSRPQVSNTLRLLKLPAPVQRRVAAGVLSAGHARALLGLSGAKEQERLAQRIVAEGLSVRAVEEIVAVGGLEPDKVPQKRSKHPQDPALADLAAALADAWETQVQVELGRSKGKISIAFASVDDLERIVEMIAPSAATVLHSRAG